MRIYVAASSNELLRAKRVMKLLREAGHFVTHDWPAEVEAVGAANPAGASFDDRSHWAHADLRGIDDSEVFWLLMPDRDPSFGAGVEFGWAMGERRLRIWEEDPGKEDLRIVVSGPHERSIFPALADAAYETDEQAFAEEFGNGHAAK